MAKIPNYLKVLIVLALGIVIYTFTGGDAPKPRKANNRFTAAPARSKAEEVFRPEDYTAKFPVVALATKNAFKPLIVKSKVLSGQVTPLTPNGIPASFAGGDGNWIYTGNGEVDGIPNALLENTKTGESVFIRPGQRWQKMLLIKVNGDRIVLQGPGGVERTVQINDQRAGAPLPANVPATTVATLPAVTPSPITGPIGFADASPASSQAGETRRGGRRRNRNNQASENSSP